MNRRAALRLGGSMAIGVCGAASLWRAMLRPAAAQPTPCAPSASGGGPYGALRDPDENGFLLPQGFRSRVVARAGDPVPGTDYVWHQFPDGGATYRMSDGWIYVSNSEAITTGGAGAIRFDRGGAIVAAYRILGETLLNCAGGATPWGTWLSCEEYDAGHVWECDPTGGAPAVKRAALGTFKHEAVAVDPRTRTLYLTEDQPDGRFYRFRPARWRDLEAGVLEVAMVAADGSVTWGVVPSPNDLTTPARRQVPESTAFAGGEGIVRRGWHVYFTTKYDNRVWDYSIVGERMRVLYSAAADPLRQLTGVDNIAVTPSGDLVVAEDGGNMELVLVSPDGVVAPLLRVIGQDLSELTGPAFAPGGERLYVSSQRGGGLGITYEISGAFRQPWPRACASEP